MSSAAALLLRMLRAQFLWYRALAFAELFRRRLQGHSVVLLDPFLAEARVMSGKSLAAVVEYVDMCATRKASDA